MEFTIDPLDIKRPGRLFIVAESRMVGAPLMGRRNVMQYAPKIWQIIFNGP
jgi:hypothetical protein